MGEGVGQGVGVARRVILVFWGVWKGKRGAGGVCCFSIFSEGGSVAGQLFVLACVKKELLYMLKLMHYLELDLGSQLLLR